MNLRWTFTSEEIREAFNRKMIGIVEARLAIATLTEWVSIGDWAAWEGRVLLYIEPHLDDTLEDAEELLTAAIFEQCLRPNRQDG